MTFSSTVTSTPLYALRKAVAYFVKDDSLLDKYCSYEQLHVSISTRMCGWRGQGDMEKVVHKMILDAFTTHGGDKVYTLPFWPVVGGEETNPDYGVLDTCHKRESHEMLLKLSNNR